MAAAGIAAGGAAWYYIGQPWAALVGLLALWPYFAGVGLVNRRGPLILAARAERVRAEIGRRPGDHDANSAMYVSSEPGRAKVLMRVPAAAEHSALALTNESLVFAGTSRTDLRTLRFSRAAN